MIAGLKPYLATKESNVEWLGKLPAHWSVERLKGCMVNVIEQTTFRNDKELYIALEHVESWTGRLTEVDESIEFDSQVKCFRAGDILFGKLRPYLAKVTRPRGNGVCVGEFLVLRPRERRILGGYMERSLRSKPTIDAVDSSTFGAKMPRADWQFIGAMQIAVPPVTEQSAIVRFLDHAERRIQRYISAKRKLIALLEEQKQAIIHKFATGRVDVRTGKRHRAYKDSGVEWLGSVPSHWEVQRVKIVAQILRGKFTHRPRNDPSLYGGRYPFIQTGEVARAEKAITTFRQTLNDRGLSVSQRFPSGTLVMTIAANIGDVAVLDFEACFPDSIVGLVPREGVERDFLYFVFRAMKPELLREAPVNTQGNLNINRIGSRGIAIPHECEQTLIVRQIEAQTARVSDAIDQSVCATGIECCSG